MKIKLLSTIIASLVIAGCGSDNDNSVTTPKTKTYTLQAFDGAIKGIEGTFNCANGETGKITKTNGYGKSDVSNNTLTTEPETCTVEFTQTSGAIDMSNSKDMSNVSYSIPKGLMAAGKPAAATPISSLIAKYMKDNQIAEFDNSTASEVFSLLEIDTNNLNIIEFLQSPKAALEKLATAAPDTHKDLLAKTFVLSDVLTSQKGKTSTIKDMAIATKKITEALISAHPNFPKSSSNGQLINDSFVSDLESSFEIIADPEQQLPDTLKDKVTNPSTGKERDPETGEPVTGGTGGGTGGGDGSSGGGTGN
ncbi:hypothetical protein UA32_07230 [Photobacterium angustum]|uniref:Serine/threonine protein kinase n=1 Tax=Photobacterium angustum TaxID=661 RepID=A0ABX5H2B7_PHOAN|nr:hypothetical protein [Photobacterium angustum]KJG39036.1 hypothetical protein UA32_07230 [Photobacterium angustum]PSX07384.1 hypothetical protein C0W27_15265 [Photobacterium angustum]